MCGTCHFAEDKKFPSPLKLRYQRETCSDCHMHLENVDVGWVKEMDIAVRIARITPAEGQGFLEGEARDWLRRELTQRGFTLHPEGKVDVELEIALRAWRVREDRFVPRGVPVFCASVTVSLRRPGETDPFFRRRALSGPEYAPRKETAARLALRDALKVISTHLLEALGSA
ncbi:MAG: hypothetical protein ACYTHM_01285 [Planctomycetota bacterium]|jgi:hypothetical protein